MRVFSLHLSTFVSSGRGPRKAGKRLQAVGRARRTKEAAAKATNPRIELSWKVFWAEKASLGQKAAHGVRKKTPTASSPIAQEANVGHLVRTSHLHVPEQETDTRILSIYGASGGYMAKEDDSRMEAA